MGGVHVSSDDGGVGGGRSRRDTTGFCSLCKMRMLSGKRITYMV